jgi:hypothetical protein
VTENGVKKKRPAMFRQIGCHKHTTLVNVIYSDSRNKWTERKSRRHRRMETSCVGVQAQKGLQRHRWQMDRLVSKRRKKKWLNTNDDAANNKIL